MALEIVRHDDDLGAVIALADASANECRKVIGSFDEEGTNATIDAGVRMIQAVNVLLSNQKDAEQRKLLDSFKGRQQKRNANMWNRSEDVRLMKRRLGAELQGE